MKNYLAILALVPFFAVAQTRTGALDRDWNFSLQAQGQTSTGQRFESVGVATFTGLENVMAPRGGFDAAYREFRSQNNITTGVWSEAQAFQRFLKDCNIDAPIDQIAMRLGLTRVLNSQNDNDVRQVLADLGSQLNFEQKIQLASRLGGILLEGYDHERAKGGPNSEGVVTLRQMIDARRNGGKAGVCRDMSLEVSRSLEQMGITSYVVAYQTAGGGHATVLIQDPANPAKTYNINYNYVTSNETSSSASHLRQDSTIPSVGTDMRIYNSQGRQLSTLPTHLGVALNEMAGRQASDIDPMQSSENKVGMARYRVNENLVVGAGVASTPDGDRVVGTTASYSNQSENFPMRMSVVLYNNQRDTNLRGRLNSTGAFIEGEQRLISDPLTVRAGTGSVSMNVEGRVNFNMNMSRSSLSASNNGPAVSGSRDASTTGTINTNYSNGGTEVKTKLEVQGGLMQTDVRDSNSLSFDLRSVSGSVEVSQQLASNLQGFGGATVVARPEFGSQIRQEVGLLRQNGDGSLSSVVVSREGRLSGEAPVFIPGSRERISLDARYEARSYAVSSGVFCRENNQGLRDCGARTSATLKFGGR